MDRRRLAVGGRIVPYWELAGSGAGTERTIVFLQGLFRRPTDYRPFLEDLARRTGGARIVAPFLFGNGGLTRPPRSLDACAELARETLEALEIGGAGRSYELVGHSTGGTMALALASRAPPPRRVVAINPILPTSFGAAGFVPRALRIAAKQLSGSAGPWKCGLFVALCTTSLCALNAISRPDAHAALVRSIAGFRWQDLGRAREVPVQLLLGAGDEFFTPPPRLQETLRDGPLPTALVTPVPGVNSHEWLLLEPERAAERVSSASAG